MTRTMLTKDPQYRVAAFDWEKILYDICGIPKATDLYKENLQRLRDAQAYRHIYDSEIWGNLVEYRLPDEHFKPSMLESGLGTLLVDISASALFERGINFRCGDWRAKDEADAKRERYIYDLYKKNNMATVLMEGAVSCAVDGDVFFELWKPEGEDVMVIPRASTEVFPVYRFKGGGYARNPMSECHIVYETEPKVYYKRTYALLNGSCWAYTETWRLTDSGARMETQSPYYETGLDFIPVYHVKNKGSLNRYFGLSDYDNAVDLLVDLNKALSDQEDARRLNAFPVKWVQGWGVDLNRLYVAPDAVWEIPDGGSVGMLTVGAEFFRAMQEQIDRLEQLIYWVMETPAIALGDTANLRDTSGVALEILFALLVKKTRRKQNYWNVLTRMNSDYLRMLELTGVENFGGNYENALIWGDIIPRSLDKDVDTAAKAVAAQLWSVTRGMDYTGVDDADEELRRVAEEKEKLLNPYGVMPQQGTANGEPF